MTLIGYWPLNEQDGDTAFDQSGNENHGSLEGSPTQGANGIIGSKAYEFDRDGDTRVDVPNDDILNPNDEITYVGWIYFTDDTSQGSHYYLIDHSNSNRHFLIIDEDSREVWTRFTIDGSSINVRGGSANFEQWHHIASTFDGNTVIVYLDGKKVGSKEMSGSLDDVDNHINIGAFQDGSRLNGKINEIRAYNRALTQSEIQYLYNVSQRGIYTTGRKQS